MNKPRFYIQSAQYANGPYEVAYIIVDSDYSIVFTTTNEKYAEEIIAILNRGLITNAA